MIDRAYVQRMARYNRWQNENLYGVADRLSAATARAWRFFRFGPQDAEPSLVGRPDLDEPLRRYAEAARRHCRIRLALSRLGRFEIAPRGFRPDHHRLGGNDQAGLARRRADLLLRRDRPRSDQAALGPGHAYVQSPDPSSRPGALHADGGRRAALRYRSAIHAGVSDDRSRPA